MDACYKYVPLYINGCEYIYFFIIYHRPLNTLLWLWSVSVVCDCFFFLAEYPVRMSIGFCVAYVMLACVMFTVDCPTCALRRCCPNRCCCSCGPAYSISCHRLAYYSNSMTIVVYLVHVDSWLLVLVAHRRQGYKRCKKLTTFNVNMFRFDKILWFTLNVWVLSGWFSHSFASTAYFILIWVLHNMELLKWLRITNCCRKVRIMRLRRKLILILFQRIMLGFHRRYMIYAGCPHITCHRVVITEQCFH